MSTEKQIDQPIALVPKRRRGKFWIILGGVLLLVVILLLSSTGGGESLEGEIVELDTVRSRTIIETVVAPGVIRPSNEVVISPEVSGEIIFLGVEEGDRVEKGTVLVRINPDAIVAEREQARASILSAKAQASSVQSRLLRADADLKRAEGLQKKELITPQEFDALLSARDIAKAESDAAGFRVKQAEAALRQVNEALRKTTIRSPISGTVTGLRMKQGERVVGAIQMTGTEIMTISDLSEMETHVDVVETDVVGIDVGEDAFIEIDAFPDERFRGIVTQVANAPSVGGLNPSGEMTTFQVRLRILDPDVRIRPGMTATAIITTARKERTPSVPIKAVTIRIEEEEYNDVVDARDEGMETRMDRPDPMVFLFNGGVATPRTVTTGLRDDKYMEITSGLAEGDVFVSGPYSLVSRELDSGDVVRVEEESSE